MKYTIYYICLIAMLLTACAQNNDTEYKTVNIYYAAENITENNRIISHKASKLTSQSIEAQITDIFELLKSNPGNSIRSSLPPDMVLESVSVENGNALLNLSKQYNYLSGIAKTLANTCITLSVCQLNEITSVTLTVNGVAPSGGERNSFTPLDFVQTKLGLMNYENNLVLYFLNHDKTALVSEMRHTVARENESTVELVFNSLMDGPTTPQSLPVMPKNTRLLSVHSEQNICYLNLSRDFIKNRDNDERTELLTIYAIVNSLTELPGIDRVQFLIEGKRIRGFTHYELNNPIERNLEI